MAPSSAKLEVSSCKRFAQISNSSGEHRLVCSKLCALDTIDVDLSRGAISTADAEKLRSQINESGLPETDQLVIPQIQAVIANLNIANIVVDDYKLDMSMIVEALDFIEEHHKKATLESRT